MTVLADIGRFLAEHSLILGIPFLVWNLIVMIVYARDKRKAKKGKWRTPEATLLALAWALGSLGAMIGMFGFRHKTKHVKFLILVPLAFLIQWGALLAVLIAACLS